jgi:hypothetical protein
MAKLLVSDVFTPSSPARVNFIERNNINARIVRALRSKGKQIVVYGQSGSGKTTLLENKLRQVYDNHIRTNCMHGMSYESVILNAFDQLEPYFVSEKTSSSKTSKGFNFGLKFNEIKSQLSFNQEDLNGSKSERLLPPQLTGSNLAMMIGESKCCWILEDFHKLEGDEKVKLAQLMKIFMDLSDTYPTLKIIAIGAMNTARQVVQSDKEMRRRISEIEVPLMSTPEIKMIVNNGCGLLNVDIDEKIIDDIAEHSNGVASICHQLCELMCEDASIHETLEEPDKYYGDTFTYKFEYENLRFALNEYLEIESDTIKSSFEKAFRLSNSDVIIKTLANINNGSGGVEFEKLYSIIDSWGENLEIEEVKDILRDLTCEQYGCLLNVCSSSGHYNFSDPFYNSFAKAYFKMSDNLYKKKKMTIKDKTNLFNSAFTNMSKGYIGSSVVTKSNHADSVSTSTVLSDELMGVNSQGAESASRNEEFKFRNKEEKLPKPIYKADD